MTTTAATSLGITRLQHLVLWVSNVQRSLTFYRDILGFEVKHTFPGGAFLKIPGSPDDHHLGLFEQTGVPPPHEAVARMYHSAWEVAELPDLVRARRRLQAVGVLGVNRQAAAVVGLPDEGARGLEPAPGPDQVR